MATTFLRAPAEAHGMTVHQLRRDAWGLGDRPQAALALLQIACLKEPRDLDLLWQRALFEHASGELKGAENTLKRLLGLRGCDLEAMGLLARVLREQGKHEEAAGWERRRSRG